MPINSRTILRAARSRRPAGATHQPITDFPSGWVLPLTTARVHEFLAGWGTVWELHPLLKKPFTDRKDKKSLDEPHPWWEG